MDRIRAPKRRAVPRPSLTDIHARLGKNVRAAQDRVEAERLEAAVAADPLIAVAYAVHGPSVLTPGSAG